MAELTNLESKLGEVLGLAQAAADSGRKVKSLAQKERQRDLVDALNQMVKEAQETAKRCNQVAGSLKGKKTAITAEARETKQKATEMLQTYLDEGADALDGFEFLTMAEAGEVGHWEIVDALAQKAGAREVQELAQWALPIQQRHFEEARQGALELAQQEDPTASGS